MVTRRRKDVGQVQHDPVGSGRGQRRRLEGGRQGGSCPGPLGSVLGVGPSLTGFSFPVDIRLRVRAEYCEHGPALEQGVASRRPQALARQLDVFGQATAVLRSRDLGSVVCDIKFPENNPCRSCSECPRFFGISDGL